MIPTGGGTDEASNRGVCYRWAADKIITASGPAVAEEFGQAIVKALAAG